MDANASPLLMPARPIEIRSPAITRAAPAAPARPIVGRVLVGEGPRGSQARVEFRGGALAGTALQLAAGRDGVSVQLVAAAESGRLALARVVDRVEARLRARGIAMETGKRDDHRDGGGREGRDRRPK
ncbi:MAG TPA: hypothetical protein VHJ20_03190 [Polyangia bacterium]|nr:hypothetical protein [Polyangia bacterium]